MKLQIYVNEMKDYMKFNNDIGYNYPHAILIWVEINLPIKWILNKFCCQMKSKS